MHAPARALRNAFLLTLAVLALAFVLAAPDQAQADEYQYLLTAMQGEDQIAEWRVFPTPLGSNRIPIELDLCDTFYINPDGGQWASDMAAKGYTFQIFFVDGPKRTPLCQ